MSEPPERSKSKTRKVLSAVGRPVRGVGRRLRFPANKSKSSRHHGHHHHHHHSEPTTEFDDVELDDEDDDCSSSSTRSDCEQSTSSGILLQSSSRRHRHHSSATSKRGRRPSSHTNSNNNNTIINNHHAWIVARIEGHLRYTCLIMAAYLFGAAYSKDYVLITKKLLEYASVAWITSVMILVLGNYQQKTAAATTTMAAAAQQQQIQRRVTETLETTTTTARERTATAASTEDETIPLLPRPESHDGSILMDLEAPDEPFELKRSLQLMQATMPHPALEDVFVVDCKTMQRVVPNKPTMHPLETDYFTGTMMFMMRTPDCDDPTAISTLETKATSNYLRDKKRRFEFQFQICLKKIPTGRVYFSLELAKAVKMGIIQRAFVGAAMAFVRTTNNNYHYSLQGSTENGKEEKPHMAFPVEESMDRIVSTPPGEPVPVLGQEIVEDIEHYKRRKKGVQIEWIIDYTYTFSVWSAYVDFLQWRCLNLPGIRPFQLSNVIGKQPLTLTLYEIADERGTDKHFKEDMRQIVQIEMCNPKESGLGPAASQWIRDHGGKEVARRGSDTDFPVLLTSETSEENADDAPVEEEENAAALGEGIYLRSGDVIHLCEVPFSNQDNVPNEDATSSFIAYGAGYVVLHEDSSASQAAAVTIERVKKGRTDPSSSQLIKSGDTVVFKMSISGRESDGKGWAKESTRYLSVHKGWWLKWVAHASKSGHFVVHTCDDLYSGDMRSSDAHSSLLTLGGAFRISSKRWPRYQVGVAPEGSATYGGRMLGLYYPKNGRNAVPDDEDLEDDFAGEDMPDTAVGDRSKAGWLRPLQIRALEPGVMGAPSSQTSPGVHEDRSAHGDYSWLYFSSEDYRMDVPAWIEMMNRSDRVRQLAYVLRISPQEQLPVAAQEQKEERPRREAFTRLRTGRELSQVMRVGLTWKSHNTSTPGKRQNGDVQQTPPRRTVETLSPKRDDNVDFSFSTDEERDELGIEQELESEDFSISTGDGESSAEWFNDSDDEDPGDEADEETEQVERLVRKNSRVKRTAKLVGKLSKQTGKTVVATGKSAMRKVGKGTVNAGAKVGKSAVKAGVKVTKGTVYAGVKMTKGTVYASKKVGKGTVNAGKAIIAPRSVKPPSREPKFNTSKSDFFDLTKKKGHLFHMTEFPVMLAGDLSDPEQSCRTVSNMLTKMSSLSPDSEYTPNFNALLALQVHQRSEQESRFLTGGAVQIGAKPRPLKDGSVVHDCLVARCLWESHWREELCCVSSSGLLFYAPLTDTPCVELPIEDITAVRLVEPGCLSPLPGYPMLALETAWRCHYMVFLNEEVRENFRIKLMEALDTFSHTPMAKATRDLNQARFWQGFQNSVESKGKWADVAFGTKLKQRTVLNNRRMAFDLPPITEDPTQIVEVMLASSLAFSLDHLKEHPEELVQFLDQTCQLRNFPLPDIDLATTGAFCIFVNLYHCLLQHSMLLSLNGPVTKQSFGHFMRTSCYEIGGDVFSLAELHACVIRGNMSRPVSSKFPAVEPPKKSEPYRFYALGQTTPRINFVLNTGDIACTRNVPVLTPLRLDDQLNIQTAEFLRQNIRIDVQKRVILLPKVCETFRSDFTSDTVGVGNAILRYCLPFLDEPMSSLIHKLYSDCELPVTIKFSSASESFHGTLTQYYVYEDDKATNGDGSHSSY